jgi:hypothetical protein
MSQVELQSDVSPHESTPVESLPVDPSSPEPAPSQTWPALDRCDYVCSKIKGSTDYRGPRKKRMM